MPGAKRKPAYRTVVRGPVPLTSTRRILGSVAMTAAMATTLLPVTFPTVPSRPRVMIALSADPAADPATWQWEEITRFVRWKDGITVTEGRPDQSSVVRPGEARMTLNNRDGRFSRRNPLGAYYGKLSKNTPIWIQFDPGPGQITIGQMFVNEWPTRWDRTATDSFVPIVAAGIFRRLQKGEVLKSSLRRAVLMDPVTPLMAYSLEEGTAATAPVAEDGTLGVVANAESFQPGKSSLLSTPALYGVSTSHTSGSLYTGLADVGVYLPVPVHTATGIEVITMHVRWDPLHDLLAPDNVALATLSHRIEFSAGSLPRAIVQLLSRPDIGSELDIIFYDEAGNSQLELLSSPTLLIDDGNWHEIQIRLTQVGSNVVCDLYLDGALEQTATSLAAETLGATKAIVLGTFGSYDTKTVTDFVTKAPFEIAWITVHTDAAVGQYADAMNGYTGEAAHTRIKRLCNEENILFTGASATSETLGAQPTGTFLDIVRDAEAADNGVLYETGWGLGYQTLADRYNRPVAMALDFARSHIKNDPQPADDDQRLRNRWVVSRTGGSSYIADNATSIAVDGVYADAVTISLASDSILPSQAQWRVHATTVDEDRWPEIGLKLNATPDLIPAFSAMGYGSRITVDHVPSNGDPNQLDLVVEGRTVSFTNMTCDVTMHTSTNTIYNVYGIKTDLATNLSRIPSARGQSTLNTTLDTTQVSVDVISSHVRWIDSATYPTQFPFDIIVAGERMTVTAITGTGLTQTFTITRSVNGVVKGHVVGEEAQLFHAPVIAR
jgi:hypothetical protein